MAQSNAMSGCPGPSNFRLTWPHPLNFMVDGNRPLAGAFAHKQLAHRASRAREVRKAATNGIRRPVMQLMVLHEPLGLQLRNANDAPLLRAARSRDP